MTAYEKIYGRRMLDFSANISPLGMPEAVRMAAAEALARAEQYPDPDYTRLREAIARMEGCEPGQVLPGGGAADLIFRAVFAINSKKALLPIPSFSEYEQALRLTGCEIEYYELPETRDFQLPEDFPERITPETGLLFLCLPNNPTGTMPSPELAARIAARCRQTKTLLIADECFLEFPEQPETVTLKRFLADNANLLILRAFTKSFAVPGIRIGYALSSNADLLRRMKESGPPWNVSCMAEAAGIAACELAGGSYLDDLRELIATERPRLQQALADLGLRVIPGEANFILFSGPEDLDERLAVEGILIRNCSNFRGLGPGWFRTAVRNRDENQQLLDTMGRVL